MFFLKKRDRAKVKKKKINVVVIHVYKKIQYVTKLKPSH